MTLVCGGGTSSAKPGYGATLALSSSAIAAMLNNIPTPWAVGLASYIGLVTYELSTFCSTDPPPVPTMTAADILELITVNDYLGHLAAVQKFQDFIASYLWYSVCQCDSGPQPTRPAPAPTPPNMPTIDPPAIVGPGVPVAASCGHANFGYYSPDAVAGTYKLIVNYWKFDYMQSTPAPVSSVQLKLRNVNGNLAINGAGPYVEGNTTWHIEWCSGSGGNVLRTDSFFVPARSSPTNNTADKLFTVEPPSGADGFNVRITSSLNNSTEGDNIDLTLWCGSAPAGGFAVPCPPDPVTIGLLQQILDLVTLIQRHDVPFSYIRGTEHADLIGSGSFMVQGLIGLQVQITTLPTWLGRRGGSPQYIFDAGFISVGTEDGYSSTRRVNNVAIVWQPDQMSSMTLVGWTLEPGVVVRVTELKAEP